MRIRLHHYLALLLLFCCQPLYAASMHGGQAVALASAPDGAIYAATVEAGHIEILRSTDDGRQWARHARVNQQSEAVIADGENPPQLAVAPDGALLVSWSRRFEQRFTGDVRFARADNGRDFSAPVTVHQDRSVTGHSFARMHLGRDGRLTLIWLDGRDRLAAEQQGQPYQGSALYASHSLNGGRDFLPEYRLAEGTCQCCRLALAEDDEGGLLVMWRHIFPGSQRDHALLRLADGKAGEPQRITFDAWQVDACPHHGPSLAIDSKGRRHATWFSPHGEQGPVFYAQIGPEGVGQAQAVGGPRTAHASVGISGDQVVLLWKAFDGERTELVAGYPGEVGEPIRQQVLAHSDGSSDHPRLLAHQGRLLAFWNTTEHGLRGYPLP